MLGSKVVDIKEDKSKKIKVTIDRDGKNESYEYEKILIAIGRKPNTDLLNLSSTSIVVTDQGFISVDSYQRTSVNNIFAIGDISDNPMLAHKATHQG